MLSVKKQNSECRENLGKWKGKVPIDWEPIVQWQVRQKWLAKRSKVNRTMNFDQKWSAGKAVQWCLTMGRLLAKVNNEVNTKVDCRIAKRQSYNEDWTKVVCRLAKQQLCEEVYTRQIHWQMRKSKYDSKRARADMIANAQGQIRWQTRKGSLGNCKGEIAKGNLWRKNLWKGIILRTTNGRRSNIS